MRSDCDLEERRQCPRKWAKELDEFVVSRGKKTTILSVAHSVASAAHGWEYEEYHGTPVLLTECDYREALSLAMEGLRNDRAIGPEFKKRLKGV
jgi:hypothetical protein